MTEELYNKIDKFCNETDWSKYPTYEHALEDFIKGIVAEETKELEKENAELKLLKDVYKVSSSLVSDIAIEKQDQLTKAKELLERLLITSCNSDVLNLLPNCSEVLKVRVEAEQFLNSGVEK